MPTNPDKPPSLTIFLAKGGDPLLRTPDPYLKPLAICFLALAILAGFGVNSAQSQADDDDLLLFLAATIKLPKHLLITSSHLGFLQQKVRNNAPEWTILKNNVDLQMGTVNFYQCSTENIALVYLLTQEAKYAAAALAYCRESMKEDVRYNGYLHFSQCMRGPAMTLNYCGNALTAAERAELANYLDFWTNELWFNNPGGWALGAPANNYHYNFLEGTAFAGYALREAGHANAGKYLEVLFDKLNRTGGVLDYLNTRQPGGDWFEGANYGELTKLLLNSTLSAIASMDGVNYFTRSSFFPNSLIFAHYQVMPGGRYLYPAGSLARTVEMPLSPYDRDYVQAAVFWLPDSPARRYGQWYLEQVMPSYTDWGGATWWAYLYKDMIFKLELPSLPSNTLPLSYKDAGTQWLHWRSDWNAGATSVGLSGAPFRLGQGHQHMDVGSFVIWKHDYLLPDPNTLSNSGLLWYPGAHNMLQVDGSEKIEIASIPGLTFYWDTPELAYAQIDGTNLFGKYAWPEDIMFMDEWTREFVLLKPDTVVVYDRATPKPDSVYDVRFHFPVEPTLAAGLYTAGYNGGGISLLPLVSGATTIRPDTDIEQGCRAWRVQQAPANPEEGRFLNILQVASGAPPALTAQYIANGHLTTEGVLWNDNVLFFSKNSFGIKAPPPYTYTLPGTAIRTHTLFNMEPYAGYDITITRTESQTVVSVNNGGGYNANSQGVLRFTQ